MDRAWAVSPLDRCPVCESYIVYANLPRKEKVFYCGTVTQEDEIVRSCSKQGDGEPWASNMQYISTFDPPTVVALLDEIERLRREREEDDDKWTRYEELYVQARGQIVDLQLEIERLRRERKMLAEALKAVYERNKHVHTCDHCECALCPEGTGLSLKAYKALSGVMYLLDDEKGGDRE